MQVSAKAWSGERQYLGSHPTSENYVVKVCFSNFHREWWNKSVGKIILRKVIKLNFCKNSLTYLLHVFFLIMYVSSSYNYE